EFAVFSEVAEGYALHVQAVLVTSLLFALPISARQSHRRVTGWEWMWAALLAGAVIVIVTIGNPTAGQPRASLETWIWVAAVLGPLMALCLAGAKLWSGPISAVLLAVVSGTLWGLFAVLTKAVVDRLDVTSLDGLMELLHTPELYAWALVAVGGTVMQQASFGAGALTASLPAMTVTEPMIAGTLGVVALGETLRPGAAGSLTIVIAVTVMVVATTALARGQAATRTAA
ncbi:MAG: DMT family transporter, partial [Mycobacterium sp.]